MAGAPSFMDTLPLPETIITCSVMLCQCHGIVQPAATLARITKLLFVGSPFCTEPRVQVGRPGIFMNLFASLAPCAALSSACMERNAGANIIANTRQQQKRIRILLRLILADASIEEGGGQWPGVSC